MMIFQVVKFLSSICCCCCLFSEVRILRKKKRKEKEKKKRRRVQIQIGKVLQICLPFLPTSLEVQLGLNILFALKLCYH